MLELPESLDELEPESELLDEPDPLEELEPPESLEEPELLPESPESPEELEEPPLGVLTSTVACSLACTVLVGDALATTEAVDVASPPAFWVVCLPSMNAPNSPPARANATTAPMSAHAHPGMPFLVGAPGGTPGDSTGTLGIAAVGFESEGGTG